MPKYMRKIENDIENQFSSFNRTNNQMRDNFVVTNHFQLILNR